MMTNDEIARELKKVASDLDDAEMKLRQGNLDRAKYEISYAQDRIRKLLKQLN